ncbi:MAG: DUF177 domain-containing protein [Dehalococcoidia bacterium]
MFNVATLLREAIGSSRSYELDPETPVRRGSVALIRVPSGVLVRTEADVFIEDRCSRCLAPFAYPAHLDFEEVFAQQVDLLTGTRLPEPEDPDAFLIGIDHTVDITEAVRQYTEMAAEMQPLCRPDCPGLCPQCGQDLSLKVCACDRQPMDPRWAILAALKQRANG